MTDTYNSITRQTRNETAKVEEQQEQDEEKHTLETTEVPRRGGLESTLKLSQ